MELRQLRYFIRIVDMGSLSRAAGVLHIAQSALSQQVAALEAEFNCPLLDRGARGVSPTAAGQELYRHAQAILKQADDVKIAVASGSSEPTGQVIIGVPLSLVPPLGMPIFDAVRARYPGIRMLVHEELSGTILEWVKSGRLTLGIAFDDGNLEGLETTPLLEERLFLVVHPGSALARRKSVALKELAGIDLVLPGRGHGVRDRVELALAQAGLPAPRVIAEMNSLTMMKQAVQAKLGATILAWASVEAELVARRLCAVEIVRPAITRVAAMCHAATAPKGRAIALARATAVQAVRATIERAAWRGVRLLDAPPPLQADAAAGHANRPRQRRPEGR
jgi:LysR family nitrogen assimilation transcriptional regulator